MYRCIIEFNTLPDSDRTRTQHNHFIVIRRNTFVFVFVSSVEIRRFRFELGSTGIHHFVSGHDAVFFSERENLILTFTPQNGNIKIGEAEFFSDFNDFDLLGLGTIF